MRTDDDIHNALERDGDEWRTQNDAEPSVDLARITHGSNVRWPSPVLRFAGVALVIAVVVAAAALGSRVLIPPVGSSVASPTIPSVAEGSDEPTAAPTSTFVEPSASAGSTPSISPTQTQRPTPSTRPTVVQPQEITEGDVVIGRGYVVAAEDHPILLCAVVDGIGQAVSCNAEAPSVSAISFDPRKLPGADHGGVWLTVPVQLHGVWTGDEIDVRSAEPSPEGPRPLAPCESPAAGWPGDQGAGMYELRNYMSIRGSTLFGPWSASTDGIGATPDTEVLVVGTTEDAAAVSEEVRALYSSNLCVVEVAYSNDELYDVSAALHGSPERWETIFDGPLNKVAILTFDISSAAVDAVASCPDACVLRPLVALEERPQSTAVE